MNVLVTGTDGYIGTLLAPILAAQGHAVTGLDTGFYRSGWLYGVSQPTTTTVTRDTRKVTARDLEGIDAVVHLAELSNDPLGQLNPSVTHMINHRASVRLAELARAAGVARFAHRQPMPNARCLLNVMSRR